MKEKILKWCLLGFYIIGILGLIITGIDYYSELQKEKNRLLTLENILQVEKIGEEIQLELNSQNKNEEVVYEVKDPSIIEVTEDGTLISVSEGITTITVTNKDNTKTQTFVVAVGKESIYEIKNNGQKVEQLIKENQPLLSYDGINNELEPGDVLFDNVEIENHFPENTPESEINLSKDINVTGISLNTNAVTLEYNKSVKLIATIYPTNATNKNIIWSTTNSKLVSVDNNGNIKAITNQNGTATITATTKDGYYKASVIVNVKSVDTLIPSTSSIATDRITFESMSNGNAILLQSSDDFMLIDVGKGTDSCDTIVTDIKKRIGTNSIKYALISHMHVDHMGCLGAILDNGVVINNIIIKDYANYTPNSNEKVKAKNNYNSVMSILTSQNINVYQIYDKNYSLKTKKGHEFNFKNINGTELNYTIGTSASNYFVKKYNEDISITVNTEDLNRSRINLSFGNYSLKLFNLPLRDDNENLNSIPVYGTIDGYNFYIANDLTNSGVNIDSAKYKPYGNTTTLLSAYRQKTIPSRIADYYAWFIHKYFSKGTVDLYQAGHHGYSNGTTTYIANLLIDKNTKVVFTNSPDQQYGEIEEWSTNPNRLLINSKYKKYSLCDKLENDTANYHRCLNDYTIARILYVLNSKGTKKTGIFYLSNGSKSKEKPLAFGFNNPNASRITTSGGKYITYDYNSIYDTYALKQ